MSTRLMVTLSDNEAAALAQVAYIELRDPREQMRLVLRQELERRGLLPTDLTPTAPQSAQPMQAQGGRP